MYTRPPRDPRRDAPAGTPDADAVVRLGASTNRMKLCVTGYTPARGNGRPVDADLIRQAARQAGVTAELDPAALDRVVALLRAGEDAHAVVIAQGVRPGARQDAWLEPLADLFRPVLTGTIFGRLHPARPREPGCDLGGNPVPPSCPLPPATLAVPPDAGCVLGEDGMLTATSFGLVRVGDGVVRVEPALCVSPDRMTVTATIHDRDALGVRLAAGHIREEMARLGMRPDAARIAQALDRAWSERRPAEGAVLARGRPPRQGRDAWLEPLFMERDAVGTLDGQGRMNWRERGWLPTVEAGQDIARLHPAVEGWPGTDVFGQEVPAEPGRPLEVKAGKNVEVLDEGALFRALAPGVVMAGRDRVEVSELLVVPGDVGLETGNIRVQQGSVKILGAVLAGSAVEAPDCVLVGRGVEDAGITAGADVAVAWGVCMDPGGVAEIRAGGSVSAAFAQNARISAGGDVTVSRYISHSDVQAGFRIRAGGWVRVTGGRGRIMGGTVVAGEGVEANEAGSPLGVPTVLALTREDEEARLLVAEKRRLRFREKQIVERLAALMQEGAGSPWAEGHAEIRKLSAQRTEVLAGIRRVGHLLAELAREYMARAEGGRIVVRGTAHPGVVVKMGGKALHLTHPVQACRFLWDAGKRRIRMAPL